MTFQLNPHSQDLRTAHRPFQLARDSVLSPELEVCHLVNLALKRDAAQFGNERGPRSLVETQCSKHARLEPTNRVASREQVASNLALIDLNLVRARKLQPEKPRSRSVEHRG